MDDARPLTPQMHRRLADLASDLRALSTFPPQSATPTAELERVRRDTAVAQTRAAVRAALGAAIMHMLDT